MRAARKCIVSYAAVGHLQNVLSMLYAVPPSFSLSSLAARVTVVVFACRRPSPRRALARPLMLRTSSDAEERRYVRTESTPKLTRTHQEYYVPLTVPRPAVRLSVSLPMLQVVKVECAQVMVPA